MPAQIRDSWGNLQNVDELVNTGGEQTIRLLGPFPISIDTEGITESEVDLADLEEGWLILSALVFKTTGWDEGPTLEVGARSADHLNGRTIATIDLTQLDTGDGPAQYSGLDADENTPVLMTAAGKLTALISGEPGATGEANVFALIAEPA